MSGDILIVVIGMFLLIFIVTLAFGLMVSKIKANTKLEIEDLENYFFKEISILNEEIIKLKERSCKPKRVYTAKK